MRCLLYRPSWQSLRVSFLKDNRNDGGWTTGEGARKNLTELEAYVKGYSPFDTSIQFEPQQMGYRGVHEEAARLYRAINCLNAVRMGYSGQGVSESIIDHLVLDQRNMYQMRQTVTYHQMLSYAAARWDWRVVKDELAHLLSVSHLAFDRIEENLLVRQKKSNIATRPELTTFLSLMDEVRVGK